MEFNVSLNATSQPKPATGPRYASDDGIAYSLSADEILFQSRRSGKNHVMTRDVFMAMSQTRAFRTLDAHVQAIAAAQPALAKQQGAIRKVLEALVARGIMLAESDLIAFLRNAPQADKPSAFAGLAIRTCDRPEKLAALLSSLTRDQGFQAQAMDVYVVDDSRTQQAQERNANLAREAGVAYLGRAQQRQYLQHLATASGVDAHHLEYFAAPRANGVFSGGRVLNFIALLFAGYRYALLDDDFLYSPLQHKDAQEGRLALAANSRAAVRFARDFDALANAGQVPGTDLLSLHAGYVGQPLSGLLGDEQWQSVGLDDLTVTDCRAVAPDSRVLLTCQGVWGHTGSEQPHWLYVLKGQARKAFTADRDSYLRQRTTPVMMNAARQWSLHREPRFLPLAVDGSAWLPPTLPECRGEDLLFNSLLLALHPGGQALEAPFALEHGREEQHQYTDAQRQSAMTPGLATLMSDFIQTRIDQCEAQTAPDRFQWVLAQLRDLTSASAKRRETFLCEYLAWVRGDFIGQLQQQTSDWPDVPVYWQADAQAMIKANAKALMQSDDLRLGDAAEAASPEAAVEDCFARMTGWWTSAQHWPQAWQAASAQGAIAQRLQAG